ncbi:MAG: tail fiber domain-containing protein [Deltaproteobacteria bacterium]|nr:tail fiber domain-containing protein [Deltaproteobacteria bacterium]
MTIDYSIPTHPTKRLRYYNNQFLVEQDFVDEQALAIGRLQAHVRSLCVAGVVEGLAVAVDAGKLKVGAGLAIDASGHLIVLSPGVDAVALGTLDDGRYVFHVTFVEKAADVSQAPHGTDGSRRWEQVPKLAATKLADPVPPGAVVLATIDVAGNAVTRVAPDGRAHSGIKFPSTTATPTLVNAGGTDRLQLNGGGLTIRRDAAGAIGPTLRLTNGAASPGANAGVAIDFDSYAADVPEARIHTTGDGTGSSHVVFSTKTPGNAANPLGERLRLTAAGSLQFPTDVGDKILFYNNPANAQDRYGLGLAGGNLSVFCPSGGRFSVRQSSSTGLETFVVTGTGRVSVAGYSGTAGAINAPTLELGGATPTQDGRGGGVLYLHHHNNLAHQLRYEKGILSLEATSNGYGTSTTPHLRVGGVVSWGDSDTRTESRNDAGLRGDAGARSGFYQTSTPVNFPAGASGWWHLLDVRHSNPANNFAMQIAGYFYDQNLWFRKTSDNAAQAWRQVISADAAGNTTIPARLSFPNAIGDRILLYDASSTDRYGFGLNGSNLNAFIPVSARFSVRQNNHGGAEVFSVDGNGNAVTRQRQSVAALTCTKTTWEQFAVEGTILTDTVNYKALMIVGSDQGQGHARWVRMWDDVQVERHLTAAGAKLGEIGIGNGAWHGAVQFPYETIQLAPTHNLRFCFGATQRAMLSNNGVWNVNGVNYNSDVTLKRDLEPVRDALHAVSRLGAVLYRWKDEADLPGKHIGMIAQEVQAVVPNAVSDATGTLAIDYGSITALVVQAVKELAARVKMLEEKAV